MNNTYDFIIAGAGVIGINLALELKKNYPNKTVLILEKESSIGFHSSGRNSGVVHAGFYYTADSLKAKFTAEGNHFLTDYCKVKSLKINRCGKLVIAKNKEEHMQFKTLLERAKLNNVPLEEIDLDTAKKIEPRVISYQSALWSPSTAVVDPIEVLNSLLQDALKAGIEINFSNAYLKNCDTNLIQTSKGRFGYKYFINAAGLYADKIAHDFGFAKNLRILPFKGLYLYCTNPSSKFNCHIYPVPNLKNPFLGVHHTLTVDGHSKIGPTAIPAFWREQYSGFERFNFSEFLSIISDEISLLFTANFNFRELAIEEIRKYSKQKLVHESGLLSSNVFASDYNKWGKPGIRAQLVNTKEKVLVMDFCFEGDENSFHVLNAVSPAFTCSKPFAGFLLQKIENLLSKNNKL